jgi:hypothetical protein
MRLGTAKSVGACSEALLLSPGNEHVMGRGRPLRTTSRSAARDCCSLTKEAVFGSSLDGPLTCELDDYRQRREPRDCGARRCRIEAGRSSSAGVIEPKRVP